MLLKADGAAFARTVDEASRGVTTRECIPGKRVTDRRQIFPLKSGFLSSANLAWGGSGREIPIDAVVFVEHGNLNRRSLTHSFATVKDRAREPQPTITVKPSLGVA